ncbi:hypothetical protein PQR08_37580 [Caballeronia jiangsuensis]|uniref:Uncharacterized protein n=1 Tax=Caballeronia jiangsuensis TaxID=1458357 RepID=A0ABW9CZW5_9BURK
MKAINTTSAGEQRRVVVQVPGVDFLGAGIEPVIERQPSGFVSMAIITYPDGDKCGSGALGSFETEDEAYQCAVTYGRSEAERRLLMTLFE